jgi:hypothetical protein
VRLVLARTAAGPARSARAHAAAGTADGGTVR